MKLKEKLKPLLAKLKKFYDKTGLEAKIKPLINRYTQLPDKEKHTWKLGIVFAMIAVNGFMFMKPTLTSFNDMRTKLVKLQDDLDLAKEDIANTEMIIRSKVKTEKMLNTAHQRVLEAHETHPFLDALSDLAKQSGIAIKGLQPIPGMRTSAGVRGLPREYQITGFDLVAEAGYHDLGEFIALMEHYITFVQITELNIYHNPEERGRKHQIQMKFELIQKRA